MNMPKSYPNSSQYVPHTGEIESEMLKAMGLNSFEDLLRAIPQELRMKEDLPLPSGRSELDVSRWMESLSRKNISVTEVVSFLGGGSYNHFIPSAVPYLASRSEFATSYTPYQAEVSQGTLQAIYEFQTMIAQITAMDVANASLYDGASAMAEACLLARRVNERPVVLISEGVYESYVDVTRSYLQNTSLATEFIPSTGGKLDLEWLGERLADDVSAVVVQSPNRLGLVEPWKQVGKLCSNIPALFVAVGDPLAFGLLAPPGECGADVYAGEGQVLGSPVSFGGPYLGLLASRMEYVRKIPGRLVGAAKDADGRPGFVLALQTREQHIRRERATSNICTNQGLVALRAAIYLALMGRNGFREVANLCFQKSHYAARKIAEITRFSLPFGETFFKEFVVKCPVPSNAIIREGVKEGVYPGTPLRDDPHFLRIAVTENSTREDIDRLVAFLRKFGP